MTSQFHVMIAQVTREVVPRVPQKSRTMASHLRDFTRMSPPIFFRSRSEEDPRDFLDEVYKILYAMGVTSLDKAELAADNSKMWPKLCMCN